MTYVGEPVACPACGGLYEGDVTLPDGVVLRGHVQGDALCRSKQPPRRRPTTTDTSRTPASPPTQSVFEMSDEERRAREEAVLAKLKGTR